MTTAEQKKFDEMCQLMTKINQENLKFREDTVKLIQDINKKVDKKEFPINLEQDILQSTQMAIGKAISSVLEGYNSPLGKLVSDVISEHNVQLKRIVTDSFKEVIENTDFKKALTQGFTHKIAKNVVNSSEGMVDKVTNELKQSAEFKARCVLAVTNVVNELINIK